LLDQFCLLCVQYAPIFIEIILGHFCLLQPFGNLVRLQPVFRVGILDALDGLPSS
jgi:hypothetical protein